MILVVGGFASGKRAYAASLGYEGADMSAELQADCAVLVDAQDLARPDGADVEALASAIAERKAVALYTEVGSGIVPIDPAERAWRDRAGSLARELARRADCVVRMTCGIPQAIKGAMPLAAVEVVFMRHGETEANEQHRYAGWTDVALTQAGEQQALRAGVVADVAKVYVSSLSRAQRTAELCFPRAEQVVVAGLREMNFGAFEGLSARQMEDDEAYREWVEGNCEGRCPKGERRSELIERVSQEVDSIVRAALRNGDERVVIVAHGGTVMAAMYAYSSLKRDYFDWQVDNCCGYRAKARFVNGRLSLDDGELFSDLGFMGARTGRAAAAASGQAASPHPQAGISFFTNRACEYFPCHEGVDEGDFNCLFCYCPLYALGPDCGGDFSYTETGRKNCKECAIPHRGDSGTKLVVARYAQIAELARRA